VISPKNDVGFEIRERGRVSIGAALENTYCGEEVSLLVGIKSDRRRRTSAIPESDDFVAGWGVIDDRERRRTGADEGRREDHRKSA